jgi:hypothetical protein
MSLFVISITIANCGANTISLYYVKSRIRYVDGTKSISENIEWIVERYLPILLTK